jgi:small subunit ribosomal protein S1
MELQNSTPADEVPQPPSQDDDLAASESDSNEIDIPEVPVSDSEAEPMIQEPESDAPIAAEEEEVAPLGEALESSGDDDDAPSASDDSDDEDDEDDEDEQETADAFPIKRGDLIEGTIVATTPTQVEVDLGEDIIGVIPSRELEFLDRSILENLTDSAKISVYVLKPRASERKPLLSISRALEELDWREAEEYADNKQPYEGRIAGYNKGGLIVRFGRLRGFIPASQVSQERDQRGGGQSPDDRWGRMLNETIVVKVVEVNRARNRLILSERAASRESREKQKERLIGELNVGDMRKGRVISLTDFGAFVDLGGADGLVHLTEMSWSHVNHPRDLLKVGEEVEVKVISIDRERKRIGLSMKSLENDPWLEVIQGYQEDQLVQGKITKLTRFGAFASLMDNREVEGLIHVSELADYRVEHPRDVVAVGDVLTLRVLKIDLDRRRLGLSLKRANSAKYMSSDWDSWGPGSDD